MTFTEAAVHVLRLVGKPLHYKEITDVAIEKDLLSHVGKSPEVTMGARLAAIVKKGGEDNPLARVKPGVFALAEWDKDTVNKGLNDRTPALKRLAQQEAKAAENGSDSDAAEEVAAPAPDEPSTVSFDAPPQLNAEEGESMDEDEIARAELTAAATAMFAPEDDDDEPILGGSDDDDDDDEEDDSSNKRRRRRRRRGRSGDKDDDDLPTYTVSEAPGAIADAEETRDRPRSRGRDRDRERADRDRERDADRERGDRERDRDRGDRDKERNERDKDRSERDRDRDRDRGDRDRDRGDRDRDRDRGDHDKDRGRGRGDEGSGDLADVAEQVLGGFRRQGGASIKQLIDAVAKRSRSAADGQLAPWIVAACRADNLRREAKGERPRFRFGGSGRIALWEWVIDREQGRLEADVRAAAEKYQELARHRLQRRLADLPQKAFGELGLLLLEALDFSNFKVVKRPSNNAELHMSGVQRTLVGELPVAIVVRRDGRDIGREQVVDLRGALHHYGQAAVGVIVTSGSIMSGAREEASAPGATPVQFVDGARLAKLCEQTGVGVVQQTINVALPDIDLFDALRGN